MTESDNNLVPTLVGVRGWVEGEVYTLHDGDEIIIGRSRSCDISFRRLKAYLDLPREDRDNDHDFNTVSRKHIRIAIANSYVRIDDLSTNGTYIDDELMTDPIEVELGTEINIRLGTRESFVLKMQSAQDTEKEAGSSAFDNPALDNGPAHQPANEHPSQDSESLEIQT